MAEDSRAALCMFLSDEQAARRCRKLVHAADRGTSAPDARPRDDRAALRGPGHSDNFGLGRLRRLGMGRRPLRRRPAGVQETRLRDALRRVERALRRVRLVLRGNPAQARRTPKPSRRSRRRLSTRDRLKLWRLLVLQFGEVILDFIIEWEAASRRFRENNFPVDDDIELPGLSRLDLSVLAEAGLE